MDIKTPVHLPQPEPIYSEALTTAIKTSPPEGRRRGLAVLFHVIWRRRSTAMAALMTVLAVSMIWSLKQTRIYRSTVILQIDSDNGKSTDSKGESAGEDTQIAQ